MRPITVLDRGGHSGNSGESGRVIRVIQNSGNENCYPKFTRKNEYPKIQVLENSGLGIR